MKLTVVVLLLFVVIITTNSEERDSPNCNLVYKRTFCFRFSRENYKQCLEKVLDVEIIESRRLLCLRNTTNCVTMVPSCMGKKFKLCYIIKTALYMSRRVQ